MGIPQGSLIGPFDLCFLLHFDYWSAINVAFTQKNHAFKLANALFRVKLILNNE